MDKKSFDIAVGDKKITLTTGQLAPQASGAVVAQMGNTVVLATVVLGALDTSKDYFPLSVEFADKLYSGGLIKGGKWMKRDGGGSDSSILLGRIIDRQPFQQDAVGSLYDQETSRWGDLVYACLRLAC